VLVLGLTKLGAQAWGVLRDAAVPVRHVATVSAAVRALTERAAPVVIVDSRYGLALTTAVRARPELASPHVIACAALDSRQELRRALESGADDVMRFPFEPEVLVARVAAGLRAQRLRASDALLRSVVDNVPGAIYRCACDENWTMEWLSDQFEEISGYPAADFIHSAVRSFASVIHPEDREQVERTVLEAVEADRPYTLEYRIRRRDGGERWLLERGQTQGAGDGRRWLDGAIFDITARRAAEQALRERDMVEAKLVEVHASRARIVEAADRARREIERNLHDGAQQHLVSVSMQLQSWKVRNRSRLADAGVELDGIMEELRAGMAELRDLARGLHPSVLTDRGLAHALSSLVNRAAIPVELRIDLPEERIPSAVEAAAYYTVCEALTNVAKYASANRAWISVDHGENHLQIEVGDDGAGGADLNSGSGLQGLLDRVAAIDGTLELRSRPDSGTVLRARLPLRRARTEDDCDPTALSCEGGPP
jgi:PAS domain S-box-containing protein